jgi:hypothetical protein
MKAISSTRRHKKAFPAKRFFVSSDVTAEDRLARVLRNTTLSANGW